MNGLAVFEVKGYMHHAHTYVGGDKTTVPHTTFAFGMARHSWDNNANVPRIAASVAIPALQCP